MKIVWAAGLALLLLSVCGSTLAQDGLETPAQWDSLLRNFFGPPDAKEIVSVARRVPRPGKSDLLAVLWREPDPDSSGGTFGPIGEGKAALAVYDLEDPRKPHQVGHSARFNLGAVDISTVKPLSDGKFVIGVAIVDGGNCSACESASDNFLLDDRSLSPIKPPGVGVFVGPPEVSDGRLQVSTLDTRWENFGGFAHAYRSSAGSSWHLEGRGFVDDCAQNAGPLDSSPVAKGDTPGESFQSATQRFLDAAQGGQVDEAWVRYKADLHAIADWWPDEKVHLDRLSQSLEKDIFRSKAAMAKHRCHLEGLELTDNDD